MSAFPRKVKKKKTMSRKGKRVIINTRKKGGILMAEIINKEITRQIRMITME
jgi:hypothetical protein